MYAEAIGVCVMYIYLHKAWVSHHCSRERERERDDYKSPVQYSCCREGGKHMLMQRKSPRRRVLFDSRVVGKHHHACQSPQLMLFISNNYLLINSLHTLINSFLHPVIV
jgi:hypothetical protein